MGFSSSCRKTLACGIALAVVVAGPGRAAAQSPPPLFVTPARAETAAVVADAGIARARRVGVRTDLLAAALASGSSPRAPFLLNLFDDVTLSLERERLEVDGRGQSSWVGHVAGDDESMASFTWNGRHLVGGVVTRGVAYQFEIDQTGAVVVSERAPQQGPVELPSRLPPERDRVPEDRLTAPQAAASTIDLLVVYTGAARARAGGASQIQAELANAVAVTNTAFQRSAVNAEIRAVGVIEVPYVESADLYDDLSVLSPGSSVNSAVEGARNSTGADLVALVTGRPNASDGCGIAWLGPSSAYAYSVTEQACLFAGQWSFSHELGHNFGADHAPGDTPQIGLPYARGYRVGTIRTLMAYAVAGSPPRILNYSSATVTEPNPGGLATGNATQDNARRLNETAATLAAYKASVGGGPPLPPTAFAASVAGTTVTLTFTPPTSGSAVTAFELEAGPTPGSGAYGRATLAQSPTVVPNVPPGVYHMRLRSVGPGGVSSPTPDAVATVASGCVVPGPASLTASVSAGTVTLAWTASAGSGASTYTLGVGTGPGLNNLGVFPMGAATGISASPPPGTYYVRVVASNACGAGAVSADVVVSIP